MAIQRSIHPALTITARELLCALVAQHGQRGGGDVCVSPANVELARATIDADAHSDQYGHVWVHEQALLDAVKASGLDHSQRVDEVVTYRSKNATALVADRVRVLTQEGEPTNAKRLAASGVDSDAIAGALELGLIEAFRPARKRSDWYRVAA